MVRARHVCLHHRLADLCTLLLTMMGLTQFALGAPPLPDRIVLEIGAPIEDNADLRWPRASSGELRRMHRIEGREPILCEIVLPGGRRFDVVAKALYLSARVRSGQLVLAGVEVLPLLEPRPLEDVGRELLDRLRQWKLSPEEDFLLQVTRWVHGSGSNIPGGKTAATWVEQDLSLYAAAHPTLEGEKQFLKIEFWYHEPPPKSAEEVDRSATEPIGVVNVHLDPLSVVIPIQLTPEVSVVKDQLNLSVVSKHHVLVVARSAKGEAIVKVHSSRSHVVENEGSVAQVSVVDDAISPTVRDATDRVVAVARGFGANLRRGEAEELTAKWSRTLAESGHPLPLRERFALPEQGELRVELVPAANRAGWQVTFHVDKGGHPDLFECLLLK